MTPAFHRPAAAAAAGLLALALSACGGGGGAADTGGTDTGTSGNSGTDSGTGTTGGVPAQATARLLRTAAAAEALVRLAVQRTRDLRLASGLTEGLGGTGAAAPGGSRALALPLPLLSGQLRRAQAVYDDSASLCSSGSASLEVADALVARFQSDPAATLQAGEGLSLISSHCVVKAAADLGSVALGSFGTGATVDGRMDLTLSLRSGSDLLWTLRYTGFSYAPYGGAAFEPLDATLVYGTQAGVATYRLDLPGARVLQAPVVGEVGGVATIGSGALRAAVPTAAGTGHADLSYHGWHLDLATLRPTAGSVTLTGGDGSSATVSVSSGTATVRITAAAAAGGASASYAVLP